MLDYKRCDIADFESAMAQKDENVKNISTEHLYILYTKFMADACAYSSVGTFYPMGLGISSKKRAQTYLEELKARGVQI